MLQICTLLEKYIWVVSYASVLVKTHLKWIFEFTENDYVPILLYKTQFYMSSEIWN